MHERLETSFKHPLNFLKDQGYYDPHNSTHRYNLISGEEAILVILCSLETRDGKYLASIRKIMMIYLKDKEIAHLLAHKGV